MEPLNNKPLSSRLGERLSQAAMLDLAQRLIAIRSENPPGSDEGLLKSGRIGIVLVPDEETAGPRGSRHLDARGLLGRNAVGMLTPQCYFRLRVRLRVPERRSKSCAEIYCYPIYAFVRRREPQPGGRAPDPGLFSAHAGSQAASAS
jgi:hypothetical protein